MNENMKNNVLTARLTTILRHLRRRVLLIAITLSNTNVLNKREMIRRPLAYFRQIVDQMRRITMNINRNRSRP